MNEKHIIENLDAKPFAELSEDEVLQIKEHAAKCSSCLSAFLAAERSTEILKFEAAREIEPSAFFQSKVLRALKEKRGSRRPVWDLWKMWQASGALVSLMAAMVAGLFFAGAIAPGASGGVNYPAAGDTTEAVIFEQENTLRDMTSEQIFQEIYER
jgi:predicted anti-sigma-YlaC factor YlaD